ncbi:putative sensor histidine kinase TcrY [Vibrio ruber DSM 16370]|uniref:histidine kinase n=1 Tax=Vibrio ruber (strain DSM 16370 / JCM 11486 / BCRC 17186 / CECT 7878 / LMG 23124 / VR1) TaxID=1123498 RepID=A0A1R4LCX5_VIBR1|nr:HAMP domain-containing sensor histidine kinase [Vibrio ruber]SJN54378.1 putative sensor histidine kinase TcrY [Vibrio ruber DSM 16370]
MQIRRSLKIYFLFAVISVGTLVVLVFSTLAASFFIQGSDVTIRYSMTQMAREIANSEMQPNNLKGFAVYQRWEDIPELVRKHIPKLQSHQAFGKYIKRDNWFDIPTTTAFVLRYDDATQGTFYISWVFTDIVSHLRQNNADTNYYLRIMIYAIIAITLFTLIMVVLLHRIAIPIERLIGWAKELSSGNLNRAAPDFYYNELNNLAEIIHSSLQSVQTTLNREKQFLSHASHELRTPISVVRSNSQLMKRLLQKEGTEEKQQEVLDRILRAGMTMTELCETLLWLNRGQFDNLSTEPVDLEKLVHQIRYELDYLVRDKEIDITIETEPASYQLPLGMVRIVLGNLIRNAFQHTYHGQVEIIQLGQTVKIRNYSAIGDTDESLGFGLGLQLTSCIIKHYQWPYHVEELATGRDVYISFTAVETDSE